MAKIPNANQYHQVPQRDNTRVRNHHADKKIYPILVAVTMLAIGVMCIVNGYFWIGLILLFIGIFGIFLNHSSIIKK